MRPNDNFTYYRRGKKNISASISICCQILQKFSKCFLLSLKELVYMPESSIDWANVSKIGPLLW